MLPEMFILVGVGFFMKVFFDSAKRVKQTATSKNRRKKTINACMHVALGIGFIVIARLYILF